MFYVNVPDVVFHTRVESDQAPGFEWKDVKSVDLFRGKRVVLFSLPGAFTPTCSSTHLPGYELNYKEILAEDVDEVYCLSVNDSFVMNAWLKSLDIKNVKALPDGSGEFSRKMGMLVDKDNLGFGFRSWRYSAVITDNIVEKIFVEPGYGDNIESDPFLVSDCDTMLRYLKEFSTERAVRRSQAQEAKIARESAPSA